MKKLSENGTERYVFIYDESGAPYAIEYYNGYSGSMSKYYYILNVQGDVIQLVNSENHVIANYTYDAWGKLLSVTDSSGNAITDALSIANVNPIRYRGYFYDTETRLYYCNSRYYDPQMRRFINADGYVSTGQGFGGYNMFAYCQNNPVGYMDSNGNRCVSVVNADFLGGKAEEISKPRADLVSAPDLDVENEKAYKYNCYGNAISKVVLTSPTGYKRGDSAQATYEAVVKDLGKNNVRILESIDSPINENEYRVALRCGPTDYHFIRQCDDGWYNKSGRDPGGIVGPDLVTADYWYPISFHNGTMSVDYSKYYEGEIIYFAITIGWDES